MSGNLTRSLIIQMQISSRLVSEESVKSDIGMYVCQQHCSQIVQHLLRKHEQISVFNIVFCRLFSRVLLQ